MDLPGNSVGKQKVKIQGRCKTIDIEPINDRLIKVKLNYSIPIVFLNVASFISMLEPFVYYHLIKKHKKIIKYMNEEENVEEKVILRLYLLAEPVHV